MIRIPVPADLNLVVVVLVKFLHCSYPFPSSFLSLLFGSKVTVHSLSLRSEELGSLSLRVEDLCNKLFRFFSVADLPILSHLLIYSINPYLYQYEFMNIYFIFWFILINQ